MDYRLGFEGIRCFAERQNANIRPITLLVGENSSGKSTFLALCQVASSIVNSGTGGLSPAASFNEPPFLLGAYDQIASYRGGRAGRARSFSITCSMDDGRKIKNSMEAEFVPRSGQPALQVLRLSVGEVIIEIRPNSSDPFVALAVESEGRRAEAQRAEPALFLNLRADLPTSLVFNLYPQLRGVVTKPNLERLVIVLQSIHSVFGLPPYAFAPIRTSPQRTYDPVSADPKPEGSHVPMLLAQLSRSSTKDQWARLRESLDSFGTSSGCLIKLRSSEKVRKRAIHSRSASRAADPLSTWWMLAMA